MASSEKAGSVERAVARSEIEALFHRYAVLANEKSEFEQLTIVFTPDAIFRLPNGVAVNPRELSQVVQGNRPDFIRHHITSINIEF